MLLAATGSALVPPIIRAAAPEAASAGSRASTGSDVHAQSRRRVINPEQFGAAGDGATNDTAAFQALAAAVMSAGGGVISMGVGKTYIVGIQDQSDPTNWSFAPADILRFDGLSGQIKIEGNGATLKCADGLRFGAFNPDGTVHGTLGTDLSKRASPYQGMIHAENWANGEIEIENLTLDGNIQNLEIGGKWGDTGWQIKNAGLQLLDAGPVTLRNVVSINHGTDGCTYYANIRDADAEPAIPVIAERCQFEYNGRQGFSCVGGKGGVFRNCSFSYTGQNGVISSNPASGFDMEPESGTVGVDFEFDECRFLANANNGYVCDLLEAARRITFLSCTFSGDYQWSHWIRANQHTFRRCIILGNFIDVSEDDLSDGGRGLATCYLNCSFIGDSAQSPTGHLYGQGIGYVGGSGPDGTAHFENCSFDYPAEDIWISVLQRATTFVDCEFHLGRPGAYPVTGRFYGTNLVTGPGTVAPSANYGRLVVDPHYRGRGASTSPAPKLLNS